jgi:hypothetical protein
VQKTEILHAYKLHLDQKVTKRNYDSRKQFTLEMIPHIEEDETYLDRLFFDEAKFQVCGTFNRHNCHLWGSENPHDVTEHECVNHQR